MIAKSTNRKVANTAGTYPYVSSYKPSYDASKPFYQYQSKLPMLPVPSLEETCLKYLKSVQPLLKTEDERQKTASAVNSFLISSQAAELQARLLKKRDLVS